MLVRSPHKIVRHPDIQDAVRCARQDVYIAAQHAWMVKDVDARHKAGHDDQLNVSLPLALAFLFGQRCKCLAPSSWPGLSRPSTSFLTPVKQARGCPAQAAHPTRSAPLTIFGHCSQPQNSSRTASGRRPGNEPSMVLAEDLGLPKGLAMLIRSCLYGVRGGAAKAAAAIPAASAPTHLLGGLLLLIGP